MDATSEPRTIAFSPAPLEVERVLDPAWLSAALSQGRAPVRVRGFEVVETLGPSAAQLYRAGSPCGLLTWGITLRVEAPIVHRFVTRLGTAAADHGAFELLGV